jgi:hypothetical protein
MRRFLRTTATLWGLTVAGAAAGAGGLSAQSPRANLGVDYTAAFTGDDFEGLEGGFGFHGGILFPLGPLSYLGAEVAWTGIDFEDDEADEADASILDLSGVVRVGITGTETMLPYVDIRAGYGRLGFDLGVADGSVDGPSAGGGLGVLFRRAGMGIDVFARYQHHWFGEFDEDILIFDAERSGGRFILGGGVSIPFGSGM